MSRLASAYSPLESLLLFQSLACHGVDPPTFTRVADLLQANPIVTAAPDYNPARLTADALKDLYLRLLKDEIKDELHGPNDADHPTQNGDSPSSRKRKAPSPHLPSVQDAAQHSHLVPQLVNKLYARYRRHAVDEIREEEHKYDKFRRQLDEIQRGDWDERFREDIRKEAEAKAPRDEAPRQPSAERAQSAGAEAAQKEAQGAAKSPAPVEKAHPAGQGPSPPAAPSTQEQRRSSAKIEALINPPSSASPNAANGAGSPRKTSAPSPLLPAHATPGPVALQRTPSQPLPQNVGLPPPQPHAGYHRLSSPYAPPLAPSGPGHSPSPTSQNVPIASRPPANPVVLPPPPGMHIPPPPVQVPSMPEPNGQFRPPSGSPHHSPPHQYAPRPFAPGAQSPAAHHHQQMQLPAGYFPYPSQPPFPPQQATPQMYVPPRQPGGIMLAPFQVSPQDPVRAHQEQQRAMQQQQQQATQHPIRPAPSPRTAVATPIRPSPYAQTPGPQPPLPPQSVVATPRTAFRTPRPPQLQLQIGTPIGSWKKPLAQATYPAPEWNPAPVSPISPGASPVPPSAPQTTKKTAKRAAKSKEMPAPDTEARTGRATNRKTTGRRARAGSAASSAVTGSARGRTRSQSVASHPEETVLGVKAEPSTPAETMESDAQSPTEATPSSGRRTRRHGGGLQSVSEQSQTTGTKRKRDARDESETMEPDVPEIDMNMGTPSPPTVVVAAKHFNRMSNPVMNDITSHKHASLFATPVKTKDAEGYYDIIRRPQDLKSIRAAINYGNRAVAAATASSADTPSAASPSQQQPATPTQSSTSTYTTLPISEDLVPPKSIVNGAQLERELMRMFANAVMFNSGGEGVVRDAVEMAKDVEASVANWRAVAVTDEDMGESEGGKKRRM